MLSWRGGLSLEIGCNVLLMANLPDDGRVVRGASPESKLSQTAVEIGEGLGRNVRGPNLHRCAYRGVKHPCRYDDHRPGLCFNQHNVRAGALLSVEPPDMAPMERVPSIVYLYVLPDMGRITQRLP